ncbi:hypothetical protein LMTR13_25670 [Bradyrhizobium icense]|uniref:Uncharacterized protein n=1 Tax=Bradyrhizobium icense TaxID=1274631 RepID=A0A1B1UJV5_9BRAD|nr:hypothetical protein LMTR13_25670 [Bradyrhizobium icense]
MCKQHISIKGVTRRTQPPREPFLAIVSHAAQSGLSAMQVQCMDVPEKMFSNFSAIVHHSSQILDTNSVRASRKEHNRLMRRKMRSEQERSADSSAISYHRCFKNAFRRDNPNGDKSRLYKIDVIE